MRVIFTRNVHEALPKGLALLASEGVIQESRNGAVVRSPLPITTVYSKPSERVELHHQRNANPWFHLLESVWMLGGRNDVEMVSEFNSQMVNYSDDGETFNAAYGHRWRKHFGQDQLTTVVKALRKDKQCRRQVIAMWDGRRDLGLQSKDLPCNTQVFVQINVDGALDIMLSNRSNDMVWGAYGSNAVHFSILHEYLAAALGVPMGIMYQVTFNMHLYMLPHASLLELPLQKQTPSPYAEGEAYQPDAIMSLKQNRWDRELQLLLTAGPTCPELRDPWLEGTIKTMWLAWREFKIKTPDRYARAKAALTLVSSLDWRQAGWHWLERHEAAALKKNGQA